MDIYQDRALVLWEYLIAVAHSPLGVERIADLFAIVTEGATSNDVRRRLGPAHAIVRMAAGAIDGTYPSDLACRVAIHIVVAAHLADPSLSERWFGFALDATWQAAFAIRAQAELRSELDVFALFDPAT